MCKIGTISKGFIDYTGTKLVMPVLARGVHWFLGAGGWKIMDLIQLKYSVYNFIPIFSQK